MDFIKMLPTSCAEAKQSEENDLPKHTWTRTALAAQIRREVYLAHNKLQREQKWDSSESVPEFDVWVRGLCQERNFPELVWKLLTDPKASQEEYFLAYQMLSSIIVNYSKGQETKKEETNPIEDNRLTLPSMGFGQREKEEAKHEEPRPVYRNSGRGWVKDYFHRNGNEDGKSYEAIIKEQLASLYRKSINKFYLHPLFIIDLRAHLSIPKEIQHNLYERYIRHYWELHGMDSKDQSCLEPKPLTTWIKKTYTIRSTVDFIEYHCEAMKQNPHPKLFTSKGLLPWYDKYPAHVLLIYLVNQVGGRENFNRFVKTNFVKGQPTGESSLIGKLGFGKPQWSEKPVLKELNLLIAIARFEREFVYQFEGEEIGIPGGRAPQHKERTQDYYQEILRLAKSLGWYVPFAEIEEMNRLGALGRFGNFEEFALRIHILLEERAHRFNIAEIEKLLEATDTDNTEEIRQNSQQLVELLKKILRLQIDRNKQYKLDYGFWMTAQEQKKDIVKSVAEKLPEPYLFYIGDHIAAIDRAISHAYQSTEDRYIDFWYQQRLKHVLVLDRDLDLDEEVEESDFEQPGHLFYWNRDLYGEEEWQPEQYVLASDSEPELGEGKE